jgi:hypothetical protein
VKNASGQAAFQPAQETDLRGLLQDSFQNAGIDLSPGTLDALVDAATSDTPGTSTAIGDVVHYEPVGNDFSPFPDMGPGSWNWPGITGGEYSGVSDWYADVPLGTIITADGNDHLNFTDEAWFAKTGGGTAGGALNNPELPTGALVIIFPALLLCLFIIRKRLVKAASK